MLPRSVIALAIMRVREHFDEAVGLAQSQDIPWLREEPHCRSGQQRDDGGAEQQAVRRQRVLHAENRAERRGRKRHVAHEPLGAIPERLPKCETADDPAVVVAGLQIAREGASPYNPAPSLL